MAVSQTENGKATIKLLVASGMSTDGKAARFMVTNGLAATDDRWKAACGKRRRKAEYDKAASSNTACGKRQGSRHVANGIVANGKAVSGNG